MHFTTISAAACFAALANANNHGHHFHRRQMMNSTSVPSTTLTVYATQTKTILSCAAIVTDCPNRPSEQTSEVVVTETIAVSTTICPVADASSISSAIASGTLPSTTPAAPVAPLSTGAGSPVVTSAMPGTTDTVLTYTLGTGTSTTVVTTTIKHTQTKTVYATPSASSGDSKATGEEAEMTGKAGGFFESSPSSTGDQSGQGAEPTTTLLSTSTHTKYITVFPAPSGGVNVPGSAGCAAPITVTETVALSTITVTAEASACPTVDAPVKIAAATSAQDGIIASPLPTEQASDAPAPITQTLIPLPVSTGAPYVNGTAPTGVANGSGAAAPTAILPTGGY